MAILTVEVRDHLGATLRSLFGRLDGHDTPQLFAALIERLEETLSARGESLTAEVRSGLVTNLPNLRAFAISLTRNGSEAEDLVQVTLLRAWQHRDKYTPGTTLAAWLFTIMRNAFYSGRRRKRLEVEDPDEAHQAKIAVAPVQGHGLDVADMWNALGRLTSDQREALILVALENLSYDDAAAVIGCKVGTVKAVSGARA
jgi:RNA polymerase sigma factor (sigma-70 family)